MMSISETLALEKQLLEKYKNYPILAEEMNFSTPSRAFNNTLSDNFASEQRLNNQNLQNKVLRLNEIDGRGQGGDNDGGKGKWWWEPSEESILFSFFTDSSMHSLKYLAQPNRHICERIFWAVIFCTAIGAAAYLIFILWQRYTDNPVIVTFDNFDLDIGFVPFPAITICNMNKLRISVVDKLNEMYMLDPTDPDLLMNLRNAQAVCDGQKSFANDFDFAYARGRININISDYTDTEFMKTRRAREDGDPLKKFIEQNTQPCDQIIPLCRYGGIKIENCSLEFKDVITEYGKCCTFNSLPTHLMERGVDEQTDHDFTETRDWADWTTTAKTTFRLPDDWSGKYPKTQTRPGSPYGLSILLNVNTSEYFCPSSDSEGFRIMLHTPTEMPQMRDFALSVGLGNEIYMKVIPELTIADDEIKSYSKEKRQCVLRSEEYLQSYRHYTRTNCINECITSAIISPNQCSCSSYYMPYSARAAVRACDPDPSSVDAKCVNETRHNISSTLNTNCSHCRPLCSDIVFRTESTFTQLQNPSIWADIDPSSPMKSPPEWAGNKLAIMHIFYGDLSTVPKVRKALYGITDIIANIGGLLGLCLGFSVLSAVEILYFLTCRAYTQRIWKKRAMSRKNSQLSRIVTVDKNNLQLRPSYKDA